MVVQIDESSDELYFPDPHLGDPDGCFAIGGDLSIDRLLLAYSNGTVSYTHLTPPTKRIV